MKINYSDQKIIKGKKSIFLAGPTPRDNNILSWRSEACKILEENGFDGCVYVPEASSLKPKEDYINQANWERIALINATVIVFWIPRTLKDMPAFTTNVEFGYYIHTGKILYGRPDNAEKIKYLDWLYNVDTGLLPYNNLKDLLKESIVLCNKNYDGENNSILPLNKRKIIEKL